MPSTWARFCSLKPAVHQRMHQEATLGLLLILSSVLTQQTGRERPSLGFQLRDGPTMQAGPGYQREQCFVFKILLFTCKTVCLSYLYQNFLLGISSPWSPSQLMLSHLLYGDFGCLLFGDSPPDFPEILGVRLKTTSKQGRLLERLKGRIQEICKLCASLRTERNVSPEYRTLSFFLQPFSP